MLILAFIGAFWTTYHVCLIVLDWAYWHDVMTGRIDPWNNNK